jgi:hypothetical protein
VGGGLELAGRGEGVDNGVAGFLGGGEGALEAVG